VARALRVLAPEALAEHGKIIGVQGGGGVAHFDAILPRTHLDDAANRHVCHRIADQVVEHDFEQGRIGFDRRIQRVRGHDFDAHMANARSLLVPLAHPRELWPKRHVFGMRLLQPRLDARQLQQGGDGRLQFRADAADLAEQAMRIAPARIAAFDIHQRAQLGEPRAKFVREACGELAFAGQSLIHPRQHFVEPRDQRGQFGRVARRQPATRRIRTDAGHRAIQHGERTQPAAYQPRCQQHHQRARAQQATQKNDVERVQKVIQRAAVQRVGERASRRGGGCSGAAGVHGREAERDDAQRMALPRACVGERRFAAREEGWRCFRAACDHRTPAAQIVPTRFRVARKRRHRWISGVHGDAAILDLRQRRQ